MPPHNELAQRLQNIRLEHAQRGDLTRRIYDTLLSDSPNLDAGNFTCISPRDIERAFDLYDDSFFGGLCRRSIQGEDAAISFRLSKRMTRAGGKTSKLRHRAPVRGQPPAFYEIAISTTLLFETFDGEERSITVAGVRCADRLEALQRVMEHEVIHLVEMLLWNESSCSKPRFRSLASRLFAHSESNHRLITPLETARTRFGVAPGSRVAFTFEGHRYTGVVNRITKRATVLVEDPNGPRYSDGKNYAKFYVPTHLLEPLDAPAAS